MSPVDVAPALMLWPAPSIDASSLNFGSLPPSCVWNGPASVMLDRALQLAASPPSASIFSERSRLPDSTFLEPVNVCVSSSLTSVLERRLLTTALVGSAAGGDSKRQRGEQRQQECGTKASHRQKKLL